LFFGVFMATEAAATAWRRQAFVQGVHAGELYAELEPGQAGGPVASSRSCRRKEKTVDRLTVPLTVVTSRTEAELIVGLLSSNGVRAVVSADDAGGQDPQLQLEGVRVLIAPSDEAAARRILDEQAPG
jgi:putative signal transducing protein